MIFTKMKLCYNINTGTRLKLATLIERMVLEHFVPVFIQDLVHIKSVLFLANLIQADISKGEIYGNKDHRIRKKLSVTDSY